MRTMSTEQLGASFRDVLNWIRTGESVEVEEDGKTVAVILPPGEPIEVHHPDYAQRTRGIFGDKLISAAESNDVRSLLRGDR